MCRTSRVRMRPCLQIECPNGGRRDECDECGSCEQCDHTCSICLDTIKNDDVLGSTITSCGHRFHSACLERHKNQAILDSQHDGTDLIVSMNHHGFHCPNCREKLGHTVESPYGLWYERSSSEVARTALLSMYTKLLSMDTQTYKSCGQEYKLVFVQRCEDRARRSPEFDEILREQQEAQRSFATVDRKEGAASWHAYARLSRTTSRILTFYLKCGELDKGYIIPLVDAWLSEHGLKHPLL